MSLDHSAPADIVGLIVIATFCSTARGGRQQQWIVKRRSSYDLLPKNRTMHFVGRAVRSTRLIVRIAGRERLRGATSGSPDGGCQLRSVDRAPGVEGRGGSLPLTV